MREFLILGEGAAEILQKRGDLRLLQRYGTSVCLLRAAEPLALQGFLVFSGPVPEEFREMVEEEAGRLGIEAWNLRQEESHPSAQGAQPGAGRAWGALGPEGAV